MWWKQNQGITEFSDMNEKESPTTEPSDHVIYLETSDKVRQKS